MRRTLALALFAAAAAPSTAARVELAPPGVAPVSAPAAAASASLSAAMPVLLSPALAAAPSALPAAVLAPSAAPAAPDAPAALAPAAPSELRPALSRTVAAPLPDFSKMSGGESSRAAEADFAARAQLGAPAIGGTPALAASVPEPGPRPGPRLLKPSASRRAAAPAGELKAFGGLDHNGDLLSAALRDLPSAAGSETVLGFKPTPNSLRALAGADGVALVRGRADGRWRLVRGAPADDFDAAVLGRTEAAPSAADLTASEGRAARFAVASPSGLREWNSDMPEGAGKSLGSSALARALMRTPLAGRVLSFFGVASSRTPWARVAADWLDAGEAPLAERQMAGTVIPEWMRAELPVAAAKLGRSLSGERESEILSRSKVWVYRWHSRWSYEVNDLPDGHYDPKFGIRVMLKTDWRRLKDPKTHFRVLFAHEYTHWLQEEGVVTRRYGVEIPAVAVEQLRAMELVGWEGMKAGHVSFIAEGNMSSFENGRAWARGSMADKTSLMYRGVLGGAAYEVGVIAGRPEAAWEFLNLVIAEKGALEPREAFERVTGLKKP